MTYSWGVRHRTGRNPAAGLPIPVREGWYKLSAMRGETVLGDGRVRADWTMTHLVRARAREHGRRVFATFEGGASLTFAGLDRESDRFAAALAACGVGPGERVMALLGNGPEILIAFFGAMKAGCVIVPVNTELKGTFLEHQVGNAESAMVVAEAGLLRAFESIDGPAPARLAVVGEDAPAIPPAFFADSAVSSFTAFLAAGDGYPVPETAARPGDICAILYTSGTTGPAKGALIPHGHLFLMSASTARATGLTGDDLYYVSMPLFHINALCAQTIAALTVGARVHVVRRFSPNRWLDEVIACGATHTNLLGVMPEFLFNTAPTPRDRDHRLRVTLSVPTGPWGAEFEKRFGLRILQGFGMTECGMPFWCRLSEPVESGCAGYVEDRWYEARVADPETDMPLPAGEVGELLIRPKLPGCFFAGYYRMPERAVEAWRNLWFHTGDATRFDERGRLHYVDRMKDCIRRRGENISAFEVEQVLNAHPEIAESAVVGVRVEGAGGEEEVLAVLLPEDGAQPDPVAVLDWCVPRMPRYAVPRFVDFVGGFEKTASGKLRKGELRDAGLPPRAWDREEAGYTIARQ